MTDPTAGNETLIGVCLTALAATVAAVVKFRPKGTERILGSLQAMTDEHTRQNEKIFTKLDQVQMEQTECRVRDEARDKRVDRIEERCAMRHP